jgi:hypothetical protein
MFEFLFFIFFVIFFLCFLIGTVVSLVYNDNVEKLFKWYDSLVSLLTASVYAMLPLGIIVIIQKFFVDK